MIEGVLHPKLPKLCSIAIKSSIGSFTPQEFDLVGTDPDHASSCDAMVN